MKTTNKASSLPHFLTLFTLAVSQPIFDILGDNIEFFLFRGSDFAEVCLFAVALAALAPLLIFGVIQVASRFSYHLGVAFEVASVTLFFVLLSLLVSKLWDIQNGVLLISLSVITGAAGAYLYYQRGNFFSLIGYMAIVVVLAPSLFLWQYHLALSGDSAAQSDLITVSETEVPVFMLVLDELPLSALLNSDGEIDAGKFPNFARFAAESTWYKNASTVSDTTPLAIASLLTGQKPEPTLAGSEIPPTAAKHPNNLFTLLQGTHNIHASETITSLCPEEICSQSQEHSPSGFTRFYSTAEDSLVVYLHLVLPEQFRKYLPAIDSRWGGFQLASKGLDMSGLFYSQKQVDASIANVSRALPNDVHYLHVNTPHHPWINYPSGKRYFSGYMTEKITPAWR